MKYLADTLGLRQVAYRDWITVRAPDANEARFFNLPEDGRVAIFEIFRTAFDQTHTPMRVTITVFPADRNQFIAMTGEVPVPQDQSRSESRLSLLLTPGQPSHLVLISGPDVDAGPRRTTREPTRPGHQWCHGPHRAHGHAAS